MKHTLLVILFLSFVLNPVLSFSQSNKGEIKGKLLDTTTKEALPYATIAVYTASDTTMVTFRMSDEKGSFRVAGLPLNQQLRVIATMMGFAVYRKEFTLTSAQSETDFGEISMEPSASLLSEVLITAEMPPVLVRNDTLEFNASSFKTLPTSLVEDLLKKLPGVSVNTAGDITVNGKPVNKILVDGKEFFGSDPKVASRNLPADVIEKVQVMNDPEALLRDPDMPEIDIPQVINLKFKKGIKKGMFGKLYAGAGTQDRYEGGGILNMFRDTTQVSILGYSNNLNHPGFGFEDISRIGGFSRSGFNSMMIRSDGGFALNGISFGATGEGIQQSSGGGANFNTVFKSGIKLNLQYFYGGINADLNQVINSEQFLEQDTINTRRTRDQYSRNQSHRVGGKLEWKLDSLTDLTITPSITFTRQASDQLSLTNTLLNFASRLNESTNQQSINDNATSFSNNLSLDHRFRKKGRSFTFYGNYDYNTGLQNQYNDAVNNFYEPDSYTTYLDQLRNTDRTGLTLNNSASYTEPIHKNLSAVFRLNAEYFKDENILRTFDAAEQNGDYTDEVPDLSNGVNRRGWRNYLTTGIKWKIKDATVQPGIRFTSLNIKNSFLKNPDINQHYFYIYPSLNINWKDLYFSYNVDVREPDAADLQPVQDNTNPLFIQYGNPELQPTISNSFNLSYRKYDTKRSINYDVYAYGSVSNDAVTRERTIDENGVQTSRPVNTDGNWNLNGNGRFMKDYKYDNNRQFSLGAAMRVSYRRTLILLNDTESYSRTWALYPSLEARVNLNDKLELNQTFSLSHQRSAYENNIFDNLQFNTRESESGIILRMPKKLVWEATFDYWYNSNTAPGLQKSYGRLNGAVTFLFMKNDRAQLKLSVFDLLDQNISAYRSIRENLIEDYQTVALTRYAMLTFTYNIRNFGGKVGGTNPIFRF